MPAYFSHAIMGDNLYDEASSIGLFKVPLSKDELKGYSLGIDLACLSKRITKDPHNFNTRSFFLTMIKDIKDNKLIENNSVLALLYGHVAHYFLDINIHPLVFYFETFSRKVGIISNHHLIEGYFSAYLIEQVLNKDIMKISANYFNKINLFDATIVNLLNDVYGKVYNDHQIIDSYRRVIYLFSMLENSIKSGLCSKEMLVYFSGFKRFLKKNNLTKTQLTNDEHDIFINSITGEHHCESLLDLYNNSLDMSLESIEMINKYLYSNYSLHNLKKVFLDLSYDTSAKCSLGKKLFYIRK